MKRAVFMDRDGTITREVGYVNHEDRLELISEAGNAIALLNKNNFFTVLVTNQAGVARGYFTEDMVHKILNLLDLLLQRYDAHLDAKYYCPHHPTAGKPPYRKDCNCRKPKPGMVLQAKDEHNIDLSLSYMIGDKISDVEMGKALGMKSILVLTGYGKGEYKYQRDSWKVFPDYIARDLLDAVKWILEDEKNN
jgi:D-glycero-D-manno-heptose 1,7-bisphosphate phosphatase